jgi:hypothetical protein
MSVLISDPPLLKPIFIVLRCKYFPKLCLAGQKMRLRTLPVGQIVRGLRPKLSAIGKVFNLKGPGRVWGCNSENIHFGKMKIFSFTSILP